MNATCPTHGEVTLVRNGGCDWWECPGADRKRGGCCMVLPDESPDGPMQHWVPIADSILENARRRP